MGILDMNAIDYPATFGHTTLTPELRAKLDEAVRRAMSGRRDPEIMRQAFERMDRRREENAKRFGVQSIAVELIREGRK